MSRISIWHLAFIAFLLMNIATGAETGTSTAPERSPTYADPAVPVVPADDILLQIRSGSPVNYDNVNISGTFDLSHLDGTAAQTIKIVNSRFFGPVKFGQASMDGLVDLRGSEFIGNASFSKAKFQKEARFAGAVFHQDADFADTIFESSADFIDTKFSRDASYDNAIFNGDAIFHYTRFEGDVDFKFAQFMRQTSFASATFKNVSFLETHFEGHTTFYNSLFSGNATFAATVFASDVVFRESRFLRGSTFGLSSFQGLADFARVSFNDSAYFGGVKFNDLAYFVKAGFAQDMILEESRLYSMQLDDVTFGDSSRINLNNTDFAKFVVHWDTIQNRLVYNGAAYIALVKNYKNLEWFDDADNCYYQYRRIGQAKEPWGWTKISDIVAWISCGYGVRVSYTAFWCLFTILIFGIVFWAGKGMNKYEIVGIELPGDARLQPCNRVSFTDALYFSIAMFTTSQAPVNTYPVGVYRHLAMAEGILGWFFLGLFVVVLSGTLIR